MAKTYRSLNGRLREFIKEQKIFFVASASGDGKVNLSPKGYDALRIIDDNRVCYLDYPGSGNETARHMNEDGRLTIMFCSFGKKPMIMRLYGRGKAVSKDDNRFDEYLSLFDEENVDIVRQVICIDIESVVTSCGYGVPLYDFMGERDELRSWSAKKAAKGTLGKYMG